MLEWFFNGNLIQFSFAIIVYILINISRWEIAILIVVVYRLPFCSSIRILFCNGLLKVFWNSFTDPVFHCQVYCDQQGNFLLSETAKNSSNIFSSISTKIISISDQSKQPVVPKEKEKENGKVEQMNRQEWIAKRIQTKMTYFVRTGYVCVIFAVAINICWIYLFFRIASQVEYSPSIISS
jgi:hypothetical protein